LFAEMDVDKDNRVSRHEFDTYVLDVTGEAETTGLFEGVRSCPRRAWRRRESAGRPSPPPPPPAAPQLPQGPLARSLGAFFARSLARSLNQ
jgi:hypothetical protein